LQQQQFIRITSAVCYSLKAKYSIETAKDKLKQAQELASAEFNETALVTAYAAMFHAARALLYKDGIQEKSHYCIVVYLREQYSKAGKLDAGLLTVMDALREERHSVMYGLERLKVRENAVRFALDSAARFIAAAEKLL